MFFRKYETSEPYKRKREREREIYSLTNKRNRNRNTSPPQLPSHPNWKMLPSYNGVLETLLGKPQVWSNISYGLKSKELQKSYNVSPNTHSSSYNGIIDNSNVRNFTAKELAYHFWRQLLCLLQKLHFHFLSPKEQTSQFIIRKTFHRANKIYLGSPCPTRTRLFFASWTTSSVSPSTWVAGSANKNMRSK